MGKDILSLQAGKTTLARQIAEAVSQARHVYLNWDYPEHRKVFLPSWQTEGITPPNSIMRVASVVGCFSVPGL